MQVFRTFMTIAKKQLGSCMIYIGIFVGLMIAFANMGTKSGSEYVNYKCNLAIFDQDCSEESKYLVEFLKEKNDIVEVEETQEDIQSKIYYLQVDYVLYIREGYATTGALENVKRPGSSSGSYVDDEIQSYENSMEALKKAGYSLEEAHAITMDAMSDEGLVRTMDKEVEKGRAFGFVFLPYVLIMMMFNGLCPVLCAFNRREVQDRANISPISNVKKNMQLFLGSLLLALVLLAICLGVARMNYPSRFGATEFGLSTLNAFCMMVVAWGIVSIAGNFNLKPQNISMISNIVGLGCSFLGGVFVTLEIFSDGMLAVAKLTPTYWYIQALDKISEGQAFSTYGYCMGIELLFAAVFFGIGLVISKRRRMARAE